MMSTDGYVHVNASADCLVHELHEFALRAVDRDELTGSKTREAAFKIRVIRVIRGQLY